MSIERRNCLPSHHLRHAKTLVEMSMVLLCIVILSTMLLKGLVASRDKSRVAVCQNNLRQMGIALLDYHNIHRRFPAGCDAHSGRQTSWCTTLLPLLDQSELYEQYDPQKAWNDEANLVVSQKRVTIYQCPSTTHESTGQGDYSGAMGTTLTGLRDGFQSRSGWRSGVLLRVNDARYPPEQKAISLDQVRDGASMTFLVLECSGIPEQEAGAWANGDHCLAHDRPAINLHHQSPYKRIHEIASDHLGGAHSLMCDARVQFLSEGIDPKVLGALCTRSGRERFDTRAVE